MPTTVKIKEKVFKPSFKYIPLAFQKKKIISGNNSFLPSDFLVTNKIHKLPLQKVTIF